ncbi:MAG: hypothetical protein AAGJ81_10940 [Verrucomicrobiota bacterium]
MLIVAAVWGISGVLAILGFAIYRLFPIAMDSFEGSNFGLLEWSVLAVWVAFMIYAEGVRGFHFAFSPRVVARARALLTHPDLPSSLLAPFYCFGFFRATRKRKIVSWSVALGVIGLVLVVQLLEQPWRGIIDWGVVAGLGIGMASILFYSICWIIGKPIDFPTDLPDSD